MIFPTVTPAVENVEHHLCLYVLEGYTPSEKKYYLQVIFVPEHGNCLHADTCTNTQGPQNMILPMPRTLCLNVLHVHYTILKTLSNR